MPQKIFNKCQHSQSRFFIRKNYSNHFVPINNSYTFMPNSKLIDHGQKQEK